MGVERPRVAAAADKVRVVLRRRAKEAAARTRQRGWVGVIVLLVVVVIVALLAQTALRQYGLLPGQATAARPGDAPRGLGVAPAPSDTTTGAAPAAAPMERARSLEGQVQRDAQKLSDRIDEQTK